MKKIWKEKPTLVSKFHLRSQSVPNLFKCLILSELKLVKLLFFSHCILINAGDLSNQNNEIFCWHAMATLAPFKWSLYRVHNALRFCFSFWNSFWPVWFNEFREFVYSSRVVHHVFLPNLSLWFILKNLEFVIHLSIYSWCVLVGFEFHRNNVQSWGINSLIFGSKAYTFIRFTR